jgi:hypothetical protein
MAFLDNSGDIILDAVLTDAGRKLMAKGDGSFKIKWWSPFDDEIDYSSYNKDAQTGQEDISILRTPITEATTAASFAPRHHLMTLRGLDSTILYLPVAKYNNNARSGQYPGFPFASTSDNNETLNQVVIICDETTENKYVGEKSSGDKRIPNGFIVGWSPDKAKGDQIVIDHGLDTTELSYQTELDRALQETAWTIELDKRLGWIIDKNGNRANRIFVDNDNIATYYITEPSFLRTNIPKETKSDAVIGGPRGIGLEFSIVSSLELQGSDFLFDRLGAQALLYTPSQSDSSTQTVKYIDTIVKVRGQNTGAPIDISARFIKTPQK